MNTDKIKVTAAQSSHGNVHLRFGYDFNVSDREKVTLTYLLNGMSYERITNACQISVETVRGHIRNVYEKLHVNSKGEAIATAIKGHIV